jgi:hypothetical protein
VELGAALHERGPNQWPLMRSEDPIPLETLEGFLPRRLVNPKRVCIW